MNLFEERGRNQKLPIVIPKMEVKIEDDSVKEEKESTLVQAPVKNKRSSNDKNYIKHIFTALRGELVEKSHMFTEPPMISKVREFLEEALEKDKKTNAKCTSITKIKNKLKALKEDPDNVVFINYFRVLLFNFVNQENFYEKICQQCTKINDKEWYRDNQNKLALRFRKKFIEKW